jgi:uncharacterized membrane protein
MPHSLNVFLAAIVTLAVLDFLWLGLLMRGFYRVQLRPIARISGDALAPIWPVVALVYLLLAFGIQTFVLPRADGPGASALLSGALFGIVVYGVYDLTNYATLNGWPPVLVVVDVLWGGVVCGLTGCAVAWADRALV